MVGKNTPRWFMVSAGFPICPSGESNLLHVVDQPAGTGFSYVSTDSYAHTLAEVKAFHVSFSLL